MQEPPFRHAWRRAGPCIEVPELPVSEPARRRSVHDVLCFPPRDASQVLSGSAACLFSNQLTEDLQAIFPNGCAFGVK